VNVSSFAALTANAEPQQQIALHRNGAVSPKSDLVFSFTKLDNVFPPWFPATAV